MNEIYRILDANFNRARESLRTIEDCGRFVLNDPAITAMAKTSRSTLREIYEKMPTDKMLMVRNSGADVGTVMTSPTENVRADSQEVAIANCKRLTEALRTLEEYCKVVSPDQISSLERMRYDAYTLEQQVANRFMVAGQFERVRLYALLSAHLCQSNGIINVARQVIAGGAEAIQLREKDTNDDIFLAMAAELRSLTDETNRLLIINDRPDIAAIVGADGVHLGQHDIPINEARHLLRPGTIIGRSTHSVKEARQAINEGADYIAIGPVYPTRTKDHPPVGIETLLNVVEAMKDSGISIVAIGGINEDTAGEVISRGIKCLAVCGAVCGSDEPQKTAKKLRSMLPDD